MTTENKTLKERLNKPVKNWIKAVVWCVIYLLFVIWLGSYIWLLLLPLIFDVFITKYIPWDWWKKSENKYIRTVMSWVDAIVFALVAVYLINSFVFQNYQIPTSSLEKTLLVGDFLAVSKYEYGSRVPMTPLSMPLVQNTLPIINTKSYIESVQNKYHRLKGTTQIKRDDIVVFNFPAGDTIAFKIQNPDYYSIAYQIGYQNLKTDSVEPNPDLCYEYGKMIIASRPETFGEVMYRPVDKRENYVKRCVGLPGDSLKVVNNQIFVNGVPQEKHAGIQFNYFIQTDGTRISSSLKDKLHISNEDFTELNTQNLYDLIQKLGLDPNYPIYHIPLNEKTYKQLASVHSITKMVIEPDWAFSDNPQNDVYPLGGGTGWTRDNYGTIYIPKAGSNIELNKKNYRIYERVIRNYEHNTFSMRDGKFYLNGKEVTSYTFKMNYYWMMGDNRHKSADSRMWGFVPEDHIVGRPMFVWLSLNKDKGWFSGKIRWNRFFKSARR